MTTAHLSERDRQGLADKSIDDARRRIALAHLGACEDCAADVRRLQRTLALMKSAATPVTDTAAIWPDIRSRIESRKVVAMRNDEQARTIGASARRFLLGVAAALAIVLVSTPFLRARHETSPPQTTPAVLVRDADSLESYQEEARVLLNHLEVQRALMRPGSASMIDHDLREVDAAIEELQRAIASDPRNPALRQLLAASYRQKINLLKRADNAG